MACSSQARTPIKAKRSVGSASGIDLHGAGFARRAPQFLDRRIEEFLPGLRAHRIAEQGVVGAADQAVAPAVLLVRPAGGQIPHRLDVVIHDRPVAQRRSHDAVAALGENVEKSLQPFLVYRGDLACFGAI